MTRVMGDEQTLLIKKKDSKNIKNKNERIVSKFFKVIKEIGVPIFKYECEEGVLNFLEKFGYKYGDCVNLTNERELVFDLLFEDVEIQIQESCGIYSPTSLILYKLITYI
ncbi:hypothetical protein ACTFIW_002400 [Dictyostelium discoideum]